MGQQVSPGVWQFDVRGAPAVGRGATEAEARDELKRRHNLGVTMAAPPTAAAAPAGRGPDIVGRLKQSILGTGPSGPEMAMQAQSASDPRVMTGMLKGAGELFLPGSIPEAAIMAVLPFAGAAARGLVGGARGALAGTARAATRLAVPTATGAASGALTEGPEGAVKGAKLGLTAAAVGEAFQGTASLAEAAAQRWGNLNTTAYNTRVRNVFGPEMGQRIEQTIPSLQGRVRSVEDIIKLKDANAGGLRIIGDKMGKIEDKMVATIGTGGLVPVPTEAVDLAATVRGPAAQQAAGGPQTQVGRVTSGNTTQRTAEQAIQMAKVLQQKGRAAQGPDKIAYYEAREQVLDALQQRAGPSLGGEYAAVRGDYRKMVQLDDFLNTTPEKLFPAAASGNKPTLDLLLWGDRALRDLPASDFGPIQEMFTGPGGAAGTRPQPGAAIPLLGHARASVPIPGTKIHTYEGGRLATKEILPPGMQQQVPSPVPGVIRGVGQVAAPLSVPAINENVVGP